MWLALHLVMYRTIPPTGWLLPRLNAGPSPYGWPLAKLSVGPIPYGWYLAKLSIGWSQSG